MILTILLFAGLSILLIGLSIPLMQGRVKPNAWYGLRISYTHDNPDIWYPANSYAGKLLLYYGLFLLAVSLALPFLLDLDLTEPAPDIYAIIISIVLLVGILLVLALSYRYARKLSEE
jgi:hypothetical protein